MSDINVEKLGTLAGVIGGLWLIKGAVQWLTRHDR